MSKGITDEEAEVIIVIERACSVFSLLGCIFVLATFTLSPAFRNRAINRLVFLATFGNMLTNVATLMTRTYTLEVDSFGCQFQAFLIQVFMQGDAYWALAMAINVYLTFYHKYDARALRRMEIYYVAACYGIPFIPGFVFLFITKEGVGRPYGNAVLWCWFKRDWEVLRIASFYGPVWVSIIITMAIYIRAGRDIYMKRKKMLKFKSGSGGTVDGTRSGVNLDNGFFPGNDFFSYKTTEVTHTTEIVRPAAALAPVITNGRTSHPAAQSAEDRENNVSYSVTISADKPPDHDSLDEEEEIALTPIQSNSPTGSPATGTNPVSFPTDTITQQQQQRQQAQARRRHEANSATWPYVKCAMLFFSALLITWIPSSGNRVYSLMNQNEISKPLFFASAFVLPLQGFWNAIIYMFTSWAACKSLWATILLSLPSWMTGAGSSRRQIAIVEIASRNHPRDPMASTATRNKQTRLPTGASMKWSKGEESTSMEDLTGYGGGLGKNGFSGGTSGSRDTMDRVSPV